MKSAYDASSECSKTLINRVLKRNPQPIYKLKERVMIRYPFNIGKRAPKRRVAIAGTIIARNIPVSKYNVKYRNPDTKVVEKEWVEVTDVISLTHKKESQRKKLNNVDDFLNAAEREKRLERLFAELTWEERTTNEFERVEYLVQLNPAKDGNCQFSALADQLSRHGITNIIAYDVRQQVVNYMAEYRESPFNDRPDFETTFYQDRYETFNLYIDMMGRNSTYGDHLTLQAGSELFYVRILIVSVHGSNYDRVIVPRVGVEDIPTIRLGYHPEGNGEHYISIDENIDFVSDRVAGCLDDDDMVDGDEEFVLCPRDVGDLRDKGGKTALQRRDGFSEDDGRLPDGEYGTALPSRDDLSEDGGRLPAAGDETSLPSSEGLSEDDGRLPIGGDETALSSTEGLSEDDGGLPGGGLDANDEGMLESAGGGGLNTNDEDMLQGRAERGSHESVGSNDEITEDDSGLTEIIGACANALCIAALACTCSLPPNEEDEEKNIYLGEGAKIIPSHGSITKKDKVILWKQFRSCSFFGIHTEVNGQTIE